LDRASNNYSDLEYAEVIIVAGANVSETFPT
jgi:assimilatory nitrate reductase catalytic subunit